jgi:hypothetical protein
MSRILRSLMVFLVLASVGLISVSAMAQQTDEQAGDEQAEEEQAEEEQAEDEQAEDEQVEDEQALEPPPPPPIPGAPSDAAGDAPSQTDPSQASPDKAGQNQADRADPAGWRLLGQAAEQLARGKKTSARRLLETLAADYPDHPATAASADALAVLTRDRARPIDLGAEEEKSGLARAELAFFQTAHGILLGTELCIMAECDDSRAVVLALGAGGGLGLAASLLATSDGITPGHALLLNSGTSWGLINGLLASAALEPDDESDVAGLYAASQLGGLGVGALIWNIAQPTAGEVSMANSGGFWLGFLTFMGHVASEFSSSDEAIAWSVLIGADLGILGGALLSQRYPMSRGRTFVIDSGGVLGFLIGIGTYILSDSSVGSPTALSTMGIIGTVTGLGTATYLTRNWDKPDGGLSASWGVAPTDGGALLTIGGSF